MILKESFLEEWIRSIQKKYRSDPILTEKVILALTLLEQLVTCGLDFVFKGGTSLILLLGKPRRLSIDIDIIVPPEEREFLKQKLDKIISMGVFTALKKTSGSLKLIYQRNITNFSINLLLIINSNISCWTFYLIHILIGK